MMKSERGWIALAARAKKAHRDDDWRRLMDSARRVVPDRASLNDETALAIALERTESFLRLAGPMLAPVADTERRKRHEGGASAV